MPRRESSHCFSSASPLTSTSWGELSHGRTSCEKSCRKSSSEASSSSFHAEMSSFPEVPPYSSGRITGGMFWWREFKSQPWRKNWRRKQKTALIVHIKHFTENYWNSQLTSWFWAKEQILEVMSLWASGRIQHWAGAVRHTSERSLERFWV